MPMDPIFKTLSRPRPGGSLLQNQAFKTYQEASSIRAGEMPAFADDDPEYAEMKKQTRKREQEPVDFAEVESQLAEAQGQIESQRMALMDARDRLDVMPLTPETASQIKQAYINVARQQRAVDDFDMQLVDSYKRLREQQAAAQPDPTWWQGIIEGSPEWLKSAGAEVVQKLTTLGHIVPGVIGLGEDAIHGTDTLEEMIQQAVERNPDSRWDTFWDVVNQRGRRTVEQVGELAMTDFGDMADLLQGKRPDPENWDINPISLLMDSGLAGMGFQPGTYGGTTAGIVNKVFETEATAEDIERFVAETAFEIAVDPTSFLGTGIFSKGLKYAGKGVKKIPLLTKLGRGMERAGAGAQLLKMGAKTRSVQETAARAMAFGDIEVAGDLGKIIDEIPDKVFDDVMAGKPVDKALADVFGVEQGAQIAKQYDIAVDQATETLTKLAAEQPEMYAKMVEDALIPYGKSQTVMDALDTVKQANKLAVEAGAKTPIVAQRMFEQMQVGQRLSTWKPVFGAMTKFNKRFPQPAQVASWLREAFISRIPATGPLSRIFAAGKAKGTSQSARLYHAMGEYQAQMADELAAATKAMDLDEAGQELFRRQAIQIAERGDEAAKVAEEVTDEMMEMARSYASYIGDSAEFVRQFERLRGVSSPMLADVVEGHLEGWYGRAFSDEMRRHLADNPELIDKLWKTKRAIHEESFRLEQPKQRKLAMGTDFEQAEKFMHDHYGIPEHIKVFDTNVERVIEHRFAMAGRNIEKARQLDAMIEYYGKTLPEEDLMDFADAVRFEMEASGMRQSAKIDEMLAASKGRPEVKPEFDYQSGEVMRGKPGVPEKQIDPERLTIKVPTSKEFIKNVLERQGHEIPEGFTTALDIANQAGIRGLDDWDQIDRIAELAGTLIRKQDVDQWLAKAPGLIGTSAPEMQTRIGKYLDIITTGVRRSILSTPTSVGKDIMGNMTWLGVASKNPTAIAKHLINFLRGKADKKAMAVLNANGVMRHTRAGYEVADITGKTADVVKQQGLTGLVTSPLRLFGKRGKALQDKITAIPNKMLDIREKADQAARYALYMERKGLGWGDVDAVEDVYKYLGNFSDYASGMLRKSGQQRSQTPFQPQSAQYLRSKSLLNRIFLFYTWNMKALGFGMSGLLEHPMRAKLLFLITAGNASQQHPDMQRWAAQRGGFMHGVDRNGNPRMISVGAGSYMGPMWGAMNSSAARAVARGDLFEAVAGAGADVMRMANPVWAKPVSLFANKDTFTGDQIYLEEGQDPNRTQLADHAPAILSYLPGIRELLDVEPVLIGGDGEDADKIAYYSMNSKAKWFLEWTAPGGMALSSQTSGLVDERRTFGEAALRIGTGIPTYSLKDLRPDRKRLRMLRDINEKYREAVADLDGKPFKMALNGKMIPNDKSAKGQEIARLFDQKRDELGRENLSDDDKRRILTGYNQEYVGLFDLGNRLITGFDRFNDEIETHQLVEKTTKIGTLRSQMMDIRKRADKIDELLAPDNPFLDKLRDYQKAMDLRSRMFETPEEERERKIFEKRKGYEAAQKVKRGLFRK